MQIIPAIDIKNGKCVRLLQGDYNKETVYEDNPVNVAKRWKKQGAKIIHIIDLDGAKEGKLKTVEIIKQIIKQVKLPVQVGGGIRSVDLVKRLIGIGVTKIILGTVALENQSLLKKLIGTYGEKIAVSLDVKGKKLMKKGWLQNSEYKLIPMIKQLTNLGVKTIIYTDTVRDGTLTQPNYTDIELLRKKTKLNLIVAGGVSSIDQIKRLKDIGVNGVIIGKALYENRINLEDLSFSSYVN